MQFARRSAADVKQEHGRACRSGPNPLAAAKWASPRTSHVGGVSVAAAAEHLQLGPRSKATISLGDVEVTRTVKLQANAKESAVQREPGV